MLFCQNSEFDAFYSYFIHAKGPSSIYKTEPKARKSYSLHETVMKSNNLQYNTLCRCVDGTIVSLDKRLMFHVLFFFIISCKILCKNIFILFYNFTKIKSFECPKSKPVTNCFIFNLSK